MTAVSREETSEFEYLLTVVVRLPRLDDRARKLEPRFTCTPRYSLPTQ